VDGTNGKLCPVVDLVLSGTELKISVTPVFCNFPMLEYYRFFMISYESLQDAWRPYKKKLSYFEPENLSKLRLVHPS
jgi:hypothetical protein